MSAISHSSTPSIKSVDSSKSIDIETQKKISLNIGNAFKKFMKDQREEFEYYTITLQGLVPSKILSRVKSQFSENYFSLEFKTEYQGWRFQFAKYECLDFKEPWFTIIRVRNNRITNRMGISRTDHHDSICVQECKNKNHADFDRCKVISERRQRKKLSHNIIKELEKSIKYNEEFSKNRGDKPFSLQTYSLTGNLDKRIIHRIQSHFKKHYESHILEVIKKKKDVSYPEPNQNYILSDFETIFKIINPSASKEHWMRQSGFEHRFICTDICEYKDDHKYFK